ncbi:MAG: hypothetical protein WDZ76_09630 [Pseudohongiellaceae bacterium]
MKKSLTLTTWTVAVVWLLVSHMAIAQTDEDDVSYQDGYYFIPSVSVSRIWDDNVFFTFDSLGEIPGDDPDEPGVEIEKVSDEVTRIAPGMELGYGSDRLDWRAFLSVESEDYQEQNQLDSSSARRIAQMAVEYLPTRLMTLSLSALYSQSNTPGELNLLTTIEPGRFEAEQTSISPAVSYRFSSSSLARMQLTLSSSQLITGVDGETTDFMAEWEESLGRQDTVIYGYSYRNYAFDTGADQYSHTPTIGWEHQFSAATSALLTAGPRITEDSAEPYLGLSLMHNYETGVVSIAYELGETYLIGEAGRLEAESLRMDLTQDVGENLVFTLSPSYAKVQREVTETEAYQVALNATYRFNDALSVFATYDHNYQEEDLDILGNREFTRNVFFVGFTLRYPRPYARTTEQ